MSIVCYLNMIINYGIPYALLTDKRTVFEYKLKSNKSLENDTFTQYSYACHRLGIDLRTTLPILKQKGVLKEYLEPFNHV